MSKIKIRCSQCGKSFKSSNAKQLICPDCEDKLRRERIAKSKGSPSFSSTPAPVMTRSSSARPPQKDLPPRQPRPHWLDQQPDVKVAQPEPVESTRPPRLDLPERLERSMPPTTTGKQHPGAKAHPAPATTHGPTMQQTRSAQSNAGAAPAISTGQSSGKKPSPERKSEAKGAGKASKPVHRVAKPKREPRLPVAASSPTPEQIAAIEQRYLELAQSGEFDGIRTQISKELNIPKATVKRVVRAVREREGIPSWWDLQSYHGSPEDLERIRIAYLPLLPLPPIGTHKQIAALLNLPPGVVYQAIKVIRAEMNLPQYNPPEKHGLSALPNPVRDASSERGASPADES